MKHTVSYFKASSFTRTMHCLPTDHTLQLYLQFPEGSLPFLLYLCSHFAISFSSSSSRVNPITSSMKCFLTSQCHQEELSPLVYSPMSCSITARAIFIAVTVKVYFLLLDLSSVEGKDHDLLLTILSTIQWILKSS